MYVHVFPSRLETQWKKIKVIQSVCLLKVFLFCILFRLFLKLPIFMKKLSASCLWVLQKMVINSNILILQDYVLLVSQLFWSTEILFTVHRKILCRVIKLIGTRKKVYHNPNYYWSVIYRNTSRFLFKTNMLLPSLYRLIWNNYLILFTVNYFEVFTLLKFHLFLEEFPTFFHPRPHYIIWFYISREHSTFAFIMLCIL